MTLTNTSSYFQALQHPSTNKQGDILIAATDSFAKNARPSQKEYQQYSELFYSLISNANTSAKRLIAATLANCAYAPRLSVFYLALADISIAAPILAFSQVFTSQDLQELITKTTNLHHRIIATRTDLAPEHVNRLVDTGDDIVALRLLNNQALSLDSNQNNLLSSLREKTQNRDAAKSAKPNTNAINELLSLANTGGRLNKQTTSHIPTPAGAKAPTDLNDQEKMMEFHIELMSATESQDHKAVKHLMWERLSLSPIECEKILNDFTADTYAIVAKATDLDPLLALHSAKNLFASLEQNPSMAQRFKKIYDVLDQATCAKGLKKWQEINTPSPNNLASKMAAKPPIAHAPHFQEDGNQSRSRVRFDNRGNVGTRQNPNTVPNVETGSRLFAS